MAGERTIVTAELGWVELEPGEAPQLLPRPCIELDEGGSIISVGTGVDVGETAIVHDLGHTLLLPGMVNAHSHAFQRMIRGA
ncbi:MAG: hypothetical protein KC457_23405, partial [Myxococcales bacterium]|nr:hypothetical protein [Myxococcales bacterium]